MSPEKELFVTPEEELEKTKSYNSSELVVQEGVNAGEIAENALAQIGANAEAMRRQDNLESSIPVYAEQGADRAGYVAMDKELVNRFLEQNPRSTTEELSQVRMDFAKDLREKSQIGYQSREKQTEAIQ